MSSKTEVKGYTETFRTELVALVMAGEESQSEIARRFDVPTQTLSKWVRKHRLEQPDPETGQSVAELRRRLAALERENRQLKLDQDILKKAAAYFAKASS